MRRLIVLALSAPFLLIGAAHPDRGNHATDPAHQVHPAQHAQRTAVSTSYRPCRRGPGDDRCIQLYERGVRASYADWRDRRSGSESRQTTDSRGHARHRGHSVRVAMHSTDHRARHRIRRAGERG